MAQLIFDPDIYTIDEVNEAVDTAKQQIKDGVIVTSFTSLGTSGQMAITVRPQDVLEAASRYFKIVDPVTGERKRVGSKTAIS